MFFCSVLEENILEKLHDHFFLSPSLICLLIHIRWISEGALQILCRVKCKCVVVRRSHYNAHSVGFHPFLNFWFVTLHLWSTFGPYGIYVLCCAHGGEKTASHDVVWAAFEFIVKDDRFHILCEQTHVL
jgi:hypothetical protein